MGNNRLLFLNTKLLIFENSLLPEGIKALDVSRFCLMNIYSGAESAESAPCFGKPYSVVTVNRVRRVR